jgi:hypothetical protein
MASRLIVAACLLALAAAAQGRSLAQVGLGGGLGGSGRDGSPAEAAEGPAAGSCLHTGQDNLDEAALQAQPQACSSCMGWAAAVRSLTAAGIVTVAPAAHAPPPARQMLAAACGLSDLQSPTAPLCQRSLPLDTPSAGAHRECPVAVPLRRPRRPEASTLPLGSTLAASPRRQAPPGSLPLLLRLLALPNNAASSAAL